MTNFISGLIAVVLISVFFGFYAVTLESIPLWIILVGVLALIVIDFVQSVRKGNDQADE
jgi:hypothetical protein